MPSVSLREIASRQRAIMLCILVYFGLVVASFMAPPEVAIVIGLGMIAVSITAAVFIFMLALSLYNTTTGVILGIGTLIPLVGLVILLVVNGKATGVLRKHGVKVGLLGASPAQVPDVAVPKA